MAKKVSILMALPGSGKTTWAVQKSGVALIVNMDHIMRRGDFSHEAKLMRGEKLIEATAKAVLNVLNKPMWVHEIIVDGLITTNAVAADLMRRIREGAPNIVFDIHWWTPDRKTCMYNDNNRRPISSRATIKNALFEEPNAELIQEYIVPDGQVVHHVPKRKSPYTAWKHSVELREPNGVEINTILSDPWCSGGDHKNFRGECWAAEIDPPIDPKEFKDFVELVERSDAFEWFQELWDASIETVVNTETDYYGGVQNYQQYQCSLEKFYNKLKELGLIKANNSTPETV